jgi:hypothetical protein
MYAMELLKKAPESLRNLTNLGSLEMSMSAPKYGLRSFWQSLVDRVYVLKSPSRSLRVAYEASRMQLDIYEIVTLEKFELTAKMGVVRTTWTRLVCQTTESDVHVNCDLRTNFIENDVLGLESWCEASTITHDMRWTIEDVTTKGYRLKPCTRSESKAGPV